MQPLPIDPLLPELCSTLRRARSVVLEAPPGAGKTTRAPRALLDQGVFGDGELLVLEPRRIAARMAARRVAEELGEEVGATIGYTMRFEEAAGPRTRVRFITEGILTRRLLADKRLRGVGGVVLDEFHERHLHGDIGLALLRRLQETERPDLRLLVMSATLEAAPVAAFLGGAPVLRSEGRMYEVAIEHIARSDERPLQVQIASSVRRLLDEGLDGDVLVFLPGAAEIRRAMEACGPLAERADLLLLPLHGSLSAAEQDRAVRPADRRKIIFSTNVAETSVTIDGVEAVIDSGLARVAACSPWSGVPTLRVSPIARASAAQRAGRAGRTRPGRCLRLYTRGDLMARPEHDAPEIARVDLAEAALELFAYGIDDLTSFAWLEPPPAASLAAAETLLLRLGAIDDRRRVTEIGRRMLRLPTHPRQARIIVEAERRGIAEDGCTIAAIIGERDIRSSQRPPGVSERQSSDLLAAKEAFDQAASDRFSPSRLRSLSVDPARAVAVDRVRGQLARLIDRRAARPPEGLAAREREALISILAGFPDRVGRLRRPQTSTGRAGREIVFATGGTAVLSEESALDDVELAVAVDVEERTEGRHSKTRVRVASAIEPDWLLELFTDAIRDTTEILWNEAAERVEVARRLSYEGLVIEETRSTKGDAEGASKILAEAARAKGWRSFAREGELDAWMARVAFARRACPEVGLPAIDEAALYTALATLCEGKKSFAELRDADLSFAVRSLLTPEQTRRLADLAPEHVVLPGGRRARIDYQDPAAPSIASRLQDFFGVAQGPRVAAGRVPLVLHLLAPNQRAVQVTTDLAGFWERHYPAIARELRRKYPRHSWPDDPRTAAPPAAGRPRG
jgi:ATP-dependent helicase HrpB